MKIIVLDIETTDLKPSVGKIVEIGMVELDLSNWKKKILFDSVCHEKGITLKEVENSWIVSNGFMTVDEIRHSPNLDTLKPQIQEIINQYPDGATAFNVAFDFEFLKDRGFVFSKILPCPMLLSTPILKLPGPYGDKWPKVQEAYDFFFPDNDYEEKHRGADDAFHEADIVYKLYELGHYKLT